MITADRLQTLITHTADSLTKLVAKPNLVFSAVSFLGITNGGQFCYKVIYENDQYGPIITKVFLTHLGTETKADVVYKELA